jgi:gluconokinase
LRVKGRRAIGKLFLEPDDVPDISRDLAPLAIIIMGVSGSGKSTLGKELADALSVPFLEGDVFHTPASIEKMRAGKALTDDDRWPWLDSLGRAIGVAAANSGVVIAACSALKGSYRDRLQEAISAPVCFVLLDGDYEELWHRLSKRTGHFMPAKLLSSQLDTLERPQSDEPAITLDAGQHPCVLREQVITWLTNAKRQARL